MLHQYGVGGGRTQKDITRTLFSNNTSISNSSNNSQSRTTSASTPPTSSSLFKPVSLELPPLPELVPIRRSLSLSSLNNNTSSSSYNDNNNNVPRLSIRVPELAPLPERVTLLKESPPSMNANVAIVSPIPSPTTIPSPSLPSPPSSTTVILSLNEDGSIDESFITWQQQTRAFLSQLNQKEVSHIHYSPPPTVTICR
jgi:hypothetical protein